MTTLFLSIPSIQSGHCARTVSDRLSTVNGVRAVAVDVPSRLVEVRFDPASTSVDHLKRALAGADYPVTAVTAPLCAGSHCRSIPRPARYATENSSACCVVVPCG